MAEEQEVKMEQPKPAEGGQVKPRPSTGSGWENIVDWGKDQITKVWVPRRPDQPDALLRGEDGEGGTDEKENLKG